MSKILKIVALPWNVILFRTKKFSALTLQQIQHKKLHPKLIT